MVHSKEVLINKGNELATYESGYLMYYYNTYITE